MCQSKANGGRRCGGKGRGSSFTPGSVTLGAWNTDEIIARVKSGGGLTISPRTGEEPSSGYVINEVGDCPKIPEAQFFDPATGNNAINDFIKEYSDWFSGDTTQVGFWHDKINGKVVLDRVSVVQNLEEATRLGKSRGQRSMWDVESQREIDLTF